NQFHDILPGSSIAEQYDITLKEYVEIFDEIKVLNDEVSKRLSEKFAEGYLVLNGNSFAVSDYVEVDGEYVYVENVPPKGIKALSLKRTEKKRSFEERTLENEYYEIRFNEKYEIVSLFDKVNQKQVLSNGEVGNRLRAYVDMPHVFDAWEIQEYYKENWYPVDTLLKAEFVSFGGKYGWKIQRRFRNSIIEQLICVYENKEGIYFETTADWREEHILLKAEFPVCVQADSAKYDIQFGNIERSAHYNTPWDKAAFEVCGHKYADYSDGGYGVALLNDCKYGYDVHNGVMGLSLIKCATDPNERADKGSHTFTYALYPHTGDLYESKTAELAYLLNNPLKVLCRSEGKEGQKEIEFIKTDRENVIVETIKKSESDGAIIIRMYESFGRKTETGITLGKPIKKAFACDMLENTERELSVNGREIRFTIDPFEIVTLKIE
ncbi:MAG: alpha-mannosidase, partial [Clostridia bacterium]|nr:alpha-mannosidase [Clostridia bacterium]